MGTMMVVTRLMVMMKQTPNLTSGSDDGGGRRKRGIGPPVLLDIQVTPAVAVLVGVKKTFPIQWGLST